jgi:hypothetical protein
MFLVCLLDVKFEQTLDRGAGELHIQHTSDDRGRRPSDSMEP